MTTPSRAFAPLDFLQLISIALIWGVNNVLAKVAVDAFPALMAVGLRFALVLVALAFLLRAPPKARWGVFVIVLVFVGPLHFGVQYVGLKMADEVAPMVVAMQLWAPASVLFAALVLKEVVGPLRWAGVAVAFLGAASMTFDPAVLAQSGALALVALASCFYGLGTVFVRRLGGAVSAWAMQAWLALATAPAMALASLAFERGQIEAVRAAPWQAWAAIGFGAVVSSIIANAFMFRLVQRYEVSRTTPYLLMTPVVSFTLAGLVLGDRITPQILIGACATMAGVALVALAERRLKARA